MIRTPDGQRSRSGNERPVTFGGSASMNDILCPTDLTPAGNAAVLFGSRVAARLGTSVTLLHVLDKDTRHGETAMSAKSALSHAEELASRTASARAILREGDFMKEISAESRTGHALMVAGTHGARGIRQNLFGADILKLVRKVSIPTIVVQEKTPVDLEVSTIVLPVAGHADITSLLNAVMLMAKAFSSTVHVYQIMRPGEQPSEQLLKNKVIMLQHLRSQGVMAHEVNEPSTTFSVGFAGQTEAYAEKVKAGIIAIMARASDEYRWIADAEKERLLANPSGIPVLCAV
jgi:nucleotide-binding universal stress UspA family protein